MLIRIYLWKSKSLTLDHKDPNVFILILKSLRDISLKCFVPVCLLHVMQSSLSTSEYSIPRLYTDIYIHTDRLQEAKKFFIFCCIYFILSFCVLTYAIFIFAWIYQQLVYWPWYLLFKIPGSWTIFCHS